MLLSKLLAAFLACLSGQVQARRLKPRTLEYYRQQLAPWVKGLPFDLAAADVVPFHLVGTGDAAPHLVQAAKRLMSWALAMGLVERDPFDKVKIPKVGERQRVLSRNELARLLRAAHPNFRRFLFLMRHTICRPGELRELTWGQVDLARRVLVLREFKAKDRRGDGLRERVIPLDRPACVLLAGMRRRRGAADGEPVLYSRRGAHLTRNAVRLAMRRACRRAGLDDQGERIVAYSVRHTSATAATVAGIGDRVLAEIMGHTSTRTTSRYQHLRSEHLVEAVDRISGRARQRPAGRVRVQVGVDLFGNPIYEDRRAGGAGPDAVRADG